MVYLRTIVGLSSLLALLPVRASAAGVYTISVSGEGAEEASARLPKVEVTVTNTSSKAIRISIHGHAYSDYRLFIRRDDGSFLERNATGRALVGDASASLTNASPSMEFVPMPESGEDGWVDPGKSFVESIDLNKLYDVSAGTYSLVVQGRLQNPSGDPVFSNNLRFSLR